jgi:hypothetical protein
MRENDPSLLDIPVRIRTYNAFKEKTAHKGERFLMCYNSFVNRPHGWPSRQRRNAGRLLYSSTDGL